MSNHNQPRLPWTAIAPKAYQAMAGVSATLSTSTLGRVLIDMVQTRVSQINGCAFCVDMHVRDLRKAGEGWQRINSLITWRECGFYSERERAALDWAEALTRVSHGHDQHDAKFEALKLQFSDQEIVELNWAIATINAWNRMAIGMQAPVVEKPIE
ncbi:carboxymuconolactone decarboxylase family protein [Paucibacter sp. R3-3]|uniref:Carboxymuconolactone decarboxylase family protein n=1 Tax=Roseateles agri TaxID=3098619 RepID=A0ABU5DDP1_9BURK|nr:carboxymuconolactone decarboxylase family protein [Paucibacter sp. R3-3]MDY0743926.1 carboxymuconolactone decarboxylase family protein [Paucibacter sp. R3-3]